MKILPPTQAIAPGKLILSGEHAVVYGCPALVMAVNRYVKTTVLAQPESHITFCFQNKMIEHTLTFSALMQLKDRIKRNYEDFLKGNLEIQKVLHKPLELVQFAVGLLLEVASIQSLGEMRIHMQTDSWIGCGMGSSAAAILSILVGLAHYLQITLSTDALFNLAHQAERAQHGKSSGLDLQSSLHGGCLYFKEGKISKRVPPVLPLYLVNTGQPQTNTGECIVAASTYFKNGEISHDFAAVTDALDNALKLNKMQEAIFAVRENHKLLNAIGVVPLRVQQLIMEIEKKGGAAKISGAGAVAGNNAGAVLIAIEDVAVLHEISHRYQQEIIPIQCEARGVYVN
ncbi:MAG: hddA [Gammaproteobacteria bacterium]|jgi:mevalonate kinase|nr:hddA [Gammaproteobacteria bacterium]